jgi:hypothetical protein
LRLAPFVVTSLLLLPLTSGCLVPVCLPAITETCRVDLWSDPKEIREVYAFRVDITTVESERTCWMEYRRTGPVERHRLQEVALLDSGLSSMGCYIPGQCALRWRYGYDYWFLLESDSYTVKPDMALCLYRPGYQLVLITPYQGTGGVQWTPALDLPAQMNALDQLFCPEPELFVPLTSGPRACAGSMTLDPGSASVAHRWALLCGASEYERLAAVAQQQKPVDDILRQKLQEKSEMLRDLAAH